MLPMTGASLGFATPASSPSGVSVVALPGSSAADTVSDAVAASAPTSAGVVDVSVAPRFTSGEGAVWDREVDAVAAAAAAGVNEFAVVLPLGLAGDRS